MGIVTDIQRFSLNDGPGIRTTVFLKGCNAACTWCHNPETISPQPQVLIDPSKCIGCGACVGFDPLIAAKGLPPARDQVTPDAAARCFAGALTVAGREMEAEDVLREAEQDIPYYQTSGGGVTLSGGEVMMQPVFARSILEGCRERGVATAIETNLMVDFALLEPLLPLIDLVMADIKLMDADAHRDHTGLGNEQVLINARKIAESGAAYILRTPVIPGVNDAEEEIAAIARFAKACGGNLLYYELLNFNPLGASKYEMMGKENPFRDARPLTDERMAQLKSAAEEQGVPVRVG